MGIVALLMLAPVGVLLFVAWGRSTVAWGCPPSFPTHSPDRTTSDVYQASLSAVVAGSSDDGTRKVGDRCVVRLVGRVYMRQTEVEHVSLSCASGQDGTYTLVYDSTVDRDPRGPSRRVLADPTKYHVDVTTRPPEVAYTETWNSLGGSGGAEIATTTHRARFHVETPDEPDREWIVDLTDAPGKPNGAP